MSQQHSGRKTVEELRSMPPEERQAYIDTHWYETIHSASTVSHGLRSDLSEAEKQYHREITSEYWTPARMANAIPE